MKKALKISLIAFLAIDAVLLFLALSKIFFTLPDLNFPLLEPKGLIASQQKSLMVTALLLMLMLLMMMMR